MDWKKLLVVLLVLTAAGNVFQYMNPQVVEKTTEVIKWKERVKTNVVVREVEKRAPDGSVVIERTTVDKTETSSNRDQETKTDKETNPQPVNFVAGGINPIKTTDFQLFMARRVAGPVFVYGSGGLDLQSLTSQVNWRAHAGLGFQF